MNDRHSDPQNPVDPFGATDHVEEWEDLALDLLDGTLPPATRAALDSHIERCPGCRESLDEQRRVREVLSAAPLMEPPSRIARSILPAERPRSAPRSLGERAGPARRRSMMRTWLPAAAVLLVTIGAVATYQQAFPRGGEADLALTSETSADAQSQEAGGVMSAAPAEETAPTTLAPADLAAAGQTTTTNTAPTADARLSVSAYLDALPPPALAEDTPVVLLTMPASGADSSLAALVQAVTGLSPLHPVESSNLVMFAARADRTEIDKLVALLGEPGLAVFRFVDRASEMTPAVTSMVGDDPSVFPLILETPDAGGGFAPAKSAPDARAPNAERYVLVVITSIDGG